MSDPSTYKEVILADGPQAYWPLDAADGLTDQAGAHDGTPLGGVTIGAVTGPGDALTATDFDGVDDRVTTADPVFSTAGDLTIEAWVLRANNTNTNAIWGGDATTLYPFLRMSAALDNLTFQAQNGTNTKTWTNCGISTGAWHHTLLYWSDPTDTVEAFVDGQSLGSAVSTQSFAVSPGNFLIGSHGANTARWVGRLAHVAVYLSDKRSVAERHWSWGISTAASRSPNFGLPSPTNFPSPANLPRGESLGQP